MRGFIGAVCVGIALISAPKSSPARVAEMGGGFVCNIATTSSGGETWEFWDCFYMDDGGGGGGDYYPDSPGGGSGGSYNAVCGELIQRKPEDCLNEIAMPASAEYGYGTSGHSEYADGSGLPKLIVFKNSNVTAPGISSKIESLLKTHTQQLASGVISMDVANGGLTEGLQVICKEQDYRMPYPASAGSEQCLRALNRIVQERDNKTSLTWLSQWVAANNINFSFSLYGLGFDLQTMISLFVPENSLAKKAKLINADVKCALWWQEARASGCAS